VTVRGPAFRIAQGLEAAIAKAKVVAGLATWLRPTPDMLRRLALGLIERKRATSSPAAA